MKKPCSDCPMRKDSLKRRLGKDRITEIVNSGSFVCHKDKSKQCAGHMLLRRHKNEFYALADALYCISNGIELVGHELVFDTTEDCIIHHSN